MNLLQDSIFIFVIGLSLTNGNTTGELISDNTINTDSSINPFLKCSYDEGITGVINCAAARALKMIQAAQETKTFQIYPGIELTSNQLAIERTGKAIINSEQLPTDPQEKTQKLLNLILEATSKFFSGRTIQIQIPQISAEGISRAFNEARGKRKKGMSPLLLGIGAKILLVKGLLLSGLLFMAVKALVLSKIAFVIAAVLAVQSLFSGGFNLKNLGGNPIFGGHGGGWNSGQPGWTSNSIGGGWGGNAQYPYARSIDEVNKEDEDTNKDNAHDLAYAHQKP